jgi:RNA polymerase sigma-70 factor (ECF subfamily)
MERVTEEDHNELEWSRKLAARLRDGERDAFGELVARYQKKIFVLAYGFFANREDALEIVQETFMRAFEKIGSYQPDHSLQGWIYRLAHNLCVDFYRKYAKKRNLEDGLDVAPDRMLAHDEDSQAALEKGQALAAVERAAAKLSLRQRSVLALKYGQGMKLQQVAEVMDVSLGTVKTLHHRALGRIRKRLGAGARQP